ncbi:hypothetical protein RFI_13145 [Reticulomyxa filosa]|uniref:SSD domain-containing protein n=1 Tax=Reticulomyxa filosa TaxID=46433 RepID=X6NE47_RETFI|nr:hypothetical protein RFI_13145 [Reticulomyxa filosa]|eukprot:ETO24014.1 hypothetical protein RFI_13145 [Reticulomyxa filosa]
MRTRKCVGGKANTKVLVPYWSDDIDDSGCAHLYCDAEKDVYGQTWGATPVGNVATWFSKDVSKNSSSQFPCMTFTYEFNSRYCGLENDTTNGNGNGNGMKAKWSNSFAYCKPSYLQWGSSTKDQTCDKTNSSMLFELATASMYSSDEDAISACKNKCLIDSIHCHALVFNNNTKVCYGFDWCSVKKEKGQNWTFYYVPAAFPEWMASVCATYYSWYPSKALNDRGIPYPSCFNVFLWEYLMDPKGGATSVPNFRLQNQNVLYNPYSGYLNLKIRSTSNSLLVQKIADDAVAVKFIVALRDFVDTHFNDNELWVALHGLLFDLDTQYIHITRYFVTNVLLLIIAVMLAGLLFLIHPLAAFVMLFTEIATIIEVYGFIDWADLHMNGVLALNMLVAVGLTMEFAAHIARAFMLASANPEEKIGIPHALPGQIRMKKTLREVFTPVTLTAITTFIGIAPIASSTFPYFRDYYFVLYVMMILTGWVNGAVFQPVILSFLNPATFSHENDPTPNSINHETMIATTIALNDHHSA